MPKQKQENRTDTQNDEEGDSSFEEDDDSMFLLVRSIPVDAPALESRMSEGESRVQDASVARNEHDRVASNWTEHNVPWSKMYDKIESSPRPNETRIDLNDNLCGMSMKTLMEYLMEDNVEHRKCVCLSDMRSNSPCQLGVLGLGFHDPKWFRFRFRIVPDQCGLIFDTEQSRSRVTI